jgi:hypothetical protein
MSVDWGLPVRVESNSNHSLVYKAVAIAPHAIQPRLIRIPHETTIVSPKTVNDDRGPLTREPLISIDDDR